MGTRPVGKSKGFAGAVAALLASVAHGYSYESPVGSGCHESITLSALRAARADFGIPPLEASPDERALIDDLPFFLQPDARDLAGASLLIGVRDPDLKGRNGLDMHDLASIHGHPSGQREHCLRRPEQDEPDGSLTALAECREFIRDSALRAITSGLDDGGMPDPDRRTAVDVHLEVRGQVKVALPIFYVYMGQALHALQDSFTHTFRTEDGQRVKAVLNWVEFANDALEEQRDGPAHMLALDKCDDANPLRKRNRVLATEASTKLMLAALDPDRPLSVKQAAIDRLLDESLGYEAGCSHFSRWCDAPEQMYRDPLGCSAAGAGMVPTVLLSGVALVLRRFRFAPARSGRERSVVSQLPSAPREDAPHGSFPLRRAARAWSGSPRARTFAFTAAAGALLAASPAVGQEDSAAEAVARCMPGRQIACACPGGAPGAQRCDGQGRGYSACECAGFAQAPSAATATASLVTHEEGGLPFGVTTVAGVSSDRTALSLALGARYRLDEFWRVGAAVEWNPWWSLETRRFKPGAFNAYASITRRFPINDVVSLRSSGHLGVSVLLYDLYGAPASSMGLYAALTVLGLEVKAGKRWLLVIDPFELAMPVPHLTGAPIAYRQYRITVGFQYGR
ncbi:MAG: hypothetical protein HYZ28_26360 [Myxococcales bacterium]|nr:hypothetical protein [Myxococcales bacterium]